MSSSTRPVPRDNPGVTRVRTSGSNAGSRPANGTAYGLMGYVFTQDLARALRVSEALEVGMVGLNTGVVSDPAAPFGGIKQSGLGWEGGRAGIEEFLETKYMAIPA